jgi:hypothetical protein
LPLTLKKLADRVAALESGSDPMPELWRIALGEARERRYAASIAPWERLRTDHIDGDGYIYDPAECIALYDGDRVTAIVRGGSGPYDVADVFYTSGYGAYSAELYAAEGWVSGDATYAVARKWCEDRLAELRESA